MLTAAGIRIMILYIINSDVCTQASCIILVLIFVTGKRALPAPLTSFSAAHKASSKLIKVSIRKGAAAFQPLWLAFVSVT